MRMILIDNASGYIAGDTSDLHPESQERITTLEDAAREIDLAAGVGARVYTIGTHDAAKRQQGYLVYRADINGSEAVTNIIDGQSREVIDAVKADCEYIGFVEFRAAKSFIVWRDNDILLDGRNIVAVTAADALDLYAQMDGFVDYADLMQHNGWDSDRDEGLHVTCVSPR